MRRPSRLRSTIITLLAGAFVASLTLRPAHLQTLAREAPFTCLIACGDESVRDLLSNILLFLPLGWSLRHWTTHGRTVALSFLITCAIEGLQATVIPGRDASLRDILCNTLGGALGSWLFMGWRGIVLPDPPRALRLALGASGGWLLLLGLTAIGVQTAPTTTTWFGFWTPELAFYTTYTGQLLDARMGAWTPENGRISDPEPLRRAMERDSFRLTMDLVTGSRPRGPSLIFAVIDTNEHTQVLFGQERSALWVTWRNRFESWELKGITVRIPIMPGREPGSRLHVETGRAEHAIYLTATSGDSTIAVRVPETVGLGWTTLAPWRLPLSTEWKVFNPIWLAGLVFPLAFWFARSAPAAGLGYAALVMAAGLLLVPPLGNLAATPLPEWIGAAAGVLAGWSAGRRFGRHDRNLEQAA